MHGGVGIGDGDHQFQLFGDACGATLNASGTGSFTFADGLTSVGLADLSTFALSVDFSNSTNGDPEGTFTYGLGNLRDFSASVGPGPSLTALAFDTAWVQPSTGHLADQLFEVTSLGAGGASTRLPISSTSSIPFTIGAITITSIETSPLPSAVPEPASLAMLASGLPIALVAWRRRRAA